MERQEEIRNRILRMAARHWGYQESEMDLEAFDPFIRLMVGALSGEIARLERNLEDSETRILENLLEQLSPEVLTGPLPAHAIVHAKSIEQETLIEPADQFLCVQVEGKEKFDRYFSALDNFSVVGGSIKFLEIGGSEIHAVQPNFQRERKVKAQQVVPTRSNCLWLGLELHPKLEQLPELRFFFNWLNQPRLEELLEWLSLTQWSINDHPLVREVGLQNLSAQNQNGEVVSQLGKAYSRYHLMLDAVKARYDRHFVRLKGFKPQSEAAKSDLRSLKSTYPPEFEQSYPLEDLAFLDQKLLWIKLEFPTQISKERLQATTCTLNAFPVVNLRRHREDHRLRDQVNIIPLQTDDHFFDIISVRNQSGRSYHEIPLTNIRGYRAGQYSLRRRNLGKLDHREAGRALLNLMDFIRDESAAFSAYGKDALRSKIKRLNQNVRDLEQQILEGNKEEAQISFLIAKPQEGDKKLSLTYLSTAGSSANGIATGSNLDMERFRRLDRKSLLFLTTTLGGREPLSRHERRYAYKKAIISRGRVVTREDIRAFCEATFGESLIAVEFEKDYENSIGPTAGIQRILRVTLTVQTPEEDETTRLTQRGKTLEEELNRQSSGVLPLRVHLDYGMKTQSAT